MSTSLALASGESIGDYEVVAPIRSGGMATLYLARKTGAAGFARHVAIKVVHGELAADRSFVQLFLDEARLCAQISHPNVVHVEDLGEERGRYYMVMEYVHGCSLADLMTNFAAEGRRPTVELACHVGIKLAEGLHAAHQARDARGRKLGVVHRDVSPQNVLLSMSGDVKLIDFGIAKARGSTAGIGGIAGKLAYMPPEQAFGKPVDARADIYALGVILWEMLTMERLFFARDPDLLLDRVRHPDVEPPSSREPEIPAALSNLVMRALAPSAEDRLASAGELSRGLAELVPGAASLQPSQLSALLDELMGDTIARGADPLPPEVTGTVSKKERRTETHALTDQLTRVVGRGVTWVAPESSSRRDDVTEPGADPTGPFRDETVDAPVIEAFPDAPREIAEEQTDARPKRTAAIAVASSLVSVAAVVGGYLAWSQLSDPPPPPDAGHTENVAPAPPPTSADVDVTAEEEPATIPSESEAAASAVDAGSEPPEPVVAAEAPRMRRARRRRRRPAMMRAPEMTTASRERIDGVVIVSDFED